jgi:hypothetical protein
VSRDPFDVLRDQLVRAARPRRRWRLALPFAGVLALTASGAAALTLAGHPSKPVKTSRYRVAVMPDLNTGAIGWCGSVTIRRAGGGAMGGRGCGPAGPPGTHMLAGGGLIGPGGIAFAVVDPAVATVVFGSRRVTPRRDPAVPAPWRVAVAPGRSGQLKLLDKDGHELKEPEYRGRDPRGKAVDPDHPPKARCAIHAAPLPGLRAQSARLLETIATRPAIAPAYLTCATTVYYLGKWRVRAAVVLSAADPNAPAPPLPPDPDLDVKRAGTGWLVVFGTDKASRREVLAALSASP